MALLESTTVTKAYDVAVAPAIIAGGMQAATRDASLAMHEAVTPYRHSAENRHGSAYYAEKASVALLHPSHFTPEDVSNAAKAVLEHGLNKQADALLTNMRKVQSPEGGSAFGNYNINPAHTDALEKFAALAQGAGEYANAPDALRALAQEYVAKSEERDAVVAEHGFGERTQAAFRATMPDATPEFSVSAEGVIAMSNDTRLMFMESQRDKNTNRDYQPSRKGALGGEITPRQREVLAMMGVHLPAPAQAEEQSKETAQAVIEITDPALDPAIQETEQAQDAAIMMEMHTETALAGGAIVGAEATEIAAEVEATEQATKNAATPSPVAEYNQPGYRDASELVGSAGTASLAGSTLPESLANCAGAIDDISAALQKACGGQQMTFDVSEIGSVGTNAMSEMARAQASQMAVA